MENDSLDNVKRRVLEYLSVIKVKGDLKAPIICFVGPVSAMQFKSTWWSIYAKYASLRSLVSEKHPLENR
jgi:hypothetical protein